MCTYLPVSLGLKSGFVDVQYSTANTIHLDITGEVLRIVKACKSKIISIVSEATSKRRFVNFRTSGDVNATAIWTTPTQHLRINYLTASMIAARNERTMEVP